MSQQAAQETSSVLVINLRGMVNTRSPVRTALEQLHVARRFNATIVPENNVYLGMLNLCKEHVAWCRVDRQTAEKLLKAKAEVSDGRKFDWSATGKGKEAGYTVEGLAETITSGKSRLDGSQGFRQFFRLSPPRGGFKRSIRRQFREGGILGENPELLKLTERMM
ncbi:MAG TPA: hypothetical protein VFF30_08775 [Nitrososphaerales archaeon]|nr:hypothetical protein [Nitrososphaerales archaeon]